MVTHCVVPDTQAAPGTPSDHLRWIGKFIADKRPDVIVHLGDHWDMQSLSAYDKGKAQMEGRRYEEDVEKGNDDFALLDSEIERNNRRRPRVRPIKPYNPRKVLLRGNHEYRIQRAADEAPHLVGKISYDDLDTLDWEVHDFLKPVFLDGIGYSHYWANPMTGRPYGGMVSTRLKTLGHSFTMGHQQTLDTAIRFIHGPNGPKAQRGLVAGACYLHDEDYKGYQGNAHWRGIIFKHEVDDGSYDMMEVSLDFLCRRFEGVGLNEFMAEQYGLAA